MEIHILNAIQMLRNPFFDVLMPLLSKAGNGVLAVLIACLLLVRKDTRKVGGTLLLALVLQYILGNLLLKNLVARPRPFTVNPDIALLVRQPSDYSFPSGHTSAAFCFVSALFFMKNRFWKPMLVLAILIAFSRMYLYVHYPTDILGGMLLGSLVGYMAVKGMEWYGNRKQKTEE